MFAPPFSPLTATPTLLSRLGAPLAGALAVGLALALAPAAPRAQEASMDRYGGGQAYAPPAYATTYAAQRAPQAAPRRLATLNWSGKSALDAPAWRGSEPAAYVPQPAPAYAPAVYAPAAYAPPPSRYPSMTRRERADDAPRAYARPRRAAHKQPPALADDSPRDYTWAAYHAPGAAPAEPSAPPPSGTPQGWAPFDAAAYTRPARRSEPARPVAVDYRTQGYAPPEAASPPPSVYGPAPASIYDPAPPARLSTQRAYVAARPQTPAPPVSATQAAANAMPPPSFPGGVRHYSVHREFGMRPDPTPIPPQFFTATADLTADPAGPDGPRHGPVASSGLGGTARSASVSPSTTASE